MNDEKKKNFGNRKVTENVFCEACRKKFNSKSSYRNHLKSKKHKKNLEKFKLAESTMEENTPEKVDSKPSKTTLQDLKICLFSNHESPSFEE